MATDPNNSLWRRVAGVTAGGVTTVVLALAASAVARGAWPAYGSAEPTRAYSLGMLIGRLVAGVVCLAAGAALCTRVARDGGASARVLGALVFALSLANHLRADVWAGYPVWYHVVFLGYLIPVAALAGRLAARDLPAR